MGIDAVAEPWTPRDTALWHTCEIAADLALGVVPRPRQDVRAPFVSQLAPDELYWAAGSFELWEERACGDGSYLHDSGFFFMTGAAGLGATAAVAGFRALGNHRRRRAAEEAAVPRWTPFDGGNVYVSLHGLHLHTARALLPWGWGAFTSAQMVGPGAVHLMGESRSGNVVWVLRSDWAELVFTAWALTHHPRHPQLLQGAWLPPGWLERASRLNHPVRLSSPAISR